MQGSILIVDIDPAFTESAQRTLRAEGATIHVHRDVSADLVRQIRPVVVVVPTDPSGEGESCVGVCRVLKTDRELRSIPILIAGTEPDPDAIWRYLDAPDHADDYFQKPAPSEELIARIEQLIAGQQASDFESDAYTDVTTPTRAIGREPSASNAPPPLPPRANEHASSPAAASASALPHVSPPPLRKTATLDIKVTPQDPRPTTVDLKTTPQESRSTLDVQATPPDPRGGTLDLLSSPEIESLWKPLRLEEAIRDVLEMAEPQTPLKATPEERLHYLRQTVRYHESKEKAVREAWKRMQVQAHALAERCLLAESHLVEIEQERVKRIEEVDQKVASAIRERDEAQTRASEIQAEFRAFQNEITRIFLEKDKEEQQEKARLQELQANHAQLVQELESTKQQIQDDDQRLRIFQEEVDGLHSELEFANHRLAEVTAEIDRARATIDELRARLSTTETVASERAEEIEQLRERVDRYALDESSERKKLEREHADKVAALEVGFEERLRELEEQHKEVLAEQGARHAELLEALTQTHESEIAALQAERDQALKDTGIGQERVRELVRELQSHEGVLAREREKYNVQILQLRSELETAHEKIEDAAGVIDSLRARERDLLMEIGERDERASHDHREIENLKLQLEAYRRENQSRAERYKRIGANRSHLLRKALTNIESALSMLGTTDSQGGPERSTARAVALPERAEDSLSDLIAELHEAAFSPRSEDCDEPSGFDEAFADESTTSDSQSLSRRNDLEQSEGRSLESVHRLGRVREGEHRVTEVTSIEEVDS